MDRKPPRADTLKILYTLSGNECAFPGCDHPIFNDKGLYIANLCHIEGASKGGPRYNPQQSQNERHGVSNLLFLCHRHHKETDDIEIYTVEKLREIKRSHESKFSESGKTVSKQMLNQILHDARYYWNNLQVKEFPVPDLKIERNFNQDIDALFEDLLMNVFTIKHYCDTITDSENRSLSDLYKLFEELNLNTSLLDNVSNNPFMMRNWELHNLGKPNYFSLLYLSIYQLKVKTFEELLKNSPDNNEIRNKLKIARDEFEDLYNNSYYYD